MDVSYNNLYRYKYLVVIYLDDNHIWFSVSNNRYKRCSFFGEQVENTRKYYASWNYLSNTILAEATSTLIDWGHESNNSHMLLSSRISRKNLLKTLYRASVEKNEDYHLIQGIVAGILRSGVNAMLKNIGGEIKISDCHYTFLTPIYWDYGTKTSIIRPIFIKANLVSEADPLNRVLACTELEAFLKYTQQSINYRNYKTNLSLLKFRKYGLCTFFTGTKNSTSVKLNFFYLESSYGKIIPDAPRSQYYPNIADKSTLEKNLRMYIKKKILYGASVIKQNNADISPTMNIMLAEVAQYFFSSLVRYNKYKLIDRHEHRFAFAKFDTTNSKLSEWQTSTLKSITFDQIVDALLTVNMKEFLLDATRILERKSIISDFFLMNMKAELKSNYETSFYCSQLVYAHLKSMITLHNINILVEEYNDTYDHYTFTSLAHEVYMSGAFYCALDEIRSHRPIAPPIVIDSYKTQYGSSPLPISNSPKPGPRCIVSIDIAQEDSSISCVILDENDSIEKILNLEHICTRHILSFYDISLDKHTHELRIKRKISDILEETQFTKALTNYVKTHYPKKSSKKNQTKKFGVPDISNIFSCNETSYLTEDTLLNTEILNVQVILMCYLTYIAEAVEEILIRSKDNCYPATDIGYVLVIESLFLKSVFGNGGDLKDLITRSGALKLAENTKNLLILTKGEALLPIIVYQNIETRIQPIRSYFGHVELYENYVRLALNQFVTAPEMSVREGECSIFIADEIVPIDNLYDRMISEFWSHILSNGRQENGIFFSCKMHYIKEFSELLDLKTRKELEQKLIGLIAKNFVLDSYGYTSADSFENLLVTNTCSCTIVLSNRYLQDVVIRPSARHISDIILASLDETNLFGSYRASCLFVTGKPLNLKSDSLLSRLIIQEIQDNLTFGSEYMEMSVPFSIISEPNDILQPELGKQHFAYRRLCNGRLRQVHSDSYAVRFCQKLQAISQELNTGDDSYRCLRGAEFVEENLVNIILKKGSEKSSEPVRKTFHGISLKSLDRIELIRIVDKDSSKVYPEFGERILLVEDQYSVVETFYYNDSTDHLPHQNSANTHGSSIKKEKGLTKPAPNTNWTIEAFYERNDYSALKFKTQFENRVADAELTILEDQLCISYF